VAFGAWENAKPVINTRNIAAIAPLVRNRFVFIFLLY